MRLQTPDSPRLRIGAHMPTAGGLYKALESGANIGCDTVQIFTSSPKQWGAKPLTDDAIAAWNDAAARTGVTPLVAHDSYLINLASPDAETRQKSLDAFVAELNRCEALGIDFLVSHPGAHLGSGDDTAVATLAASLDTIHARTDGFRVKVALETTAGQGTYLGGKFEHFVSILELVKNPERLVICADTCHMIDAGYDIAENPTGVWDEFDRLIGLSRLAVLHANDSEHGLGSRRDRHAHIGEGCIGDNAFAAFLADSRLPHGLPVIVETPEAESEHRRNVAKLRLLTGVAAPSVPAASTPAALALD